MGKGAKTVKHRLQFWPLHLKWQKNWFRFFLSGTTFVGSPRADILLFAWFVRVGPIKLIVGKRLMTYTETILTSKGLRAYWPLGEKETREQ